jgi:hypothetical protein
VSELAVLCPVPPGLADHVVQLLADADVAGQKAALRRGQEPLQQPPDPIYIVVQKQDMDRAKSVIELVLPQLLEPGSGSSNLSDQLVRSEDTGIKPLAVWRGPSGSTLDEPADELHDEDGNFVPPKPPPVPRPRDRVARFAWAAVVIGPFLVLAAILLNLDGFFIVIGIALGFAGFGTLIARVPDRAPPDSGWDNGAVL